MASLRGVGMSSSGSMSSSSSRSSNSLSSGLVPIDSGRVGGRTVGGKMDYEDRTLKKNGRTVEEEEESAERTEGDDIYDEDWDNDEEDDLEIESKDSSLFSFSSCKSEQDRSLAHLKALDDLFQDDLPSKVQVKNTRSTLESPEPGPRPSTGGFPDSSIRSSFETPRPATSSGSRSVRFSEQVRVNTFDKSISLDEPESPVIPSSKAVAKKQEKVEEEEHSNDEDYDDDLFGDGDNSALDSLMPDESSPSTKKSPEKPVRDDVEKPFSKATNARPNAAAIPEVSAPSTPTRGNAVSAFSVSEPKSVQSQNREDDSELGGYQMSFGRSRRSANPDSNREESVDSSKSTLRSRREIASSSKVNFQQASFVLSDSDDDNEPLFKTSKLPEHLRTVSKKEEDQVPVALKPAKSYSASVEASLAKASDETTSFHSLNQAPANLQTSNKKAVSTSQPQIVQIRTEEPSQSAQTGTFQAQVQSQVPSQVPSQVQLELQAQFQAQQAKQQQALAELIQSVRNEYSTLIEKMKKDHESQLVSIDSRCEKDRASWKDAEKSLVEDLEIEKSRNEALAQQVRRIESEGRARISAIETAHSAALARKAAESETAHALARATGMLDDTSGRLGALEAELRARYDASEKARIAQVELREKLVKDLEASARENLERAASESRSLTALQSSLEIAARQQRSALEEDRLRLREEHCRVEALQMTFKLETEQLRAAVADERATLREERLSWDSERREFRLTMEQRQQSLESEARMLEHQRQSLESERRALRQEGEQSAARLREEEARLREAKEAQQRSRRVLEEQAVKLEEERELLASQRDALGKESERLREERARVEALLAQLRCAEASRVEAALLHEKADSARAVAEAERAIVERTRRELLEEQRNLQLARLGIAEDKSKVYQKTALARREGERARALQRKAALELAFGPNNENLLVGNR